MPAKESKREKKERRWAALQEACCKYNKVIFVDVNNVTSKQISVIRKTIRPMDAAMIMGKNTLMRKAITHLATEPDEKDDDYEERKDDWKARPQLSIIKDQLNLNIGMIFTNGDLNEIKDVLDINSREAPAKIGQLAPANVTVPPGPTGLDPKQTGFFQALNVATKIVKGNIEIVNPVVLIEEGQKINGSQAALLDKLKIRPFEYKMHIQKFLDNGKLFDAKVLSMTPDTVRAKFAAKAQMAVALSLGSGYVTALAAPHLIANAFKNLASVSLAVDYDLPQLAAMKAAAAAGPAKGAAAAGGAAAEVKEEEPEKEEEMDMGGMFGDDDDY